MTGRVGAVVGMTAVLFIAGGDDTAAQLPEPMPPTTTVWHGEIVCGDACRRRAHWRRVVRPVNGYLSRIAWCESRHRWHIATGNGFYGGLQFTLSSWRAVGGRAFPHWASPLEQKYRAVRLARIQGWGAWPVCRYA